MLTANQRNIITAENPRISLVIFSKTFGGAERHVLDLANQLAGQSHDVQLIVRRAGWLNENIAGTLDPHIRVDYVSPIFKRRGLQRALKRFKPDIIHSHLGIGAQLAGKTRFNIPKIATLHGHFKAKNYERLDALICVAPWQESTIDPSYRGQIQIIPNFLAAQPSRPEERHRIRQQYGLHDDTFVIGSAGRFSRERGFDTLIRAFHEAAIPDSRLLLVGDGPEMPALRALASERVIFSGWQDDPASHYAAFDVFASAARRESFGLALLQAMQTGLPVIATRTKGPSWLLGQDAGVIVPIDDAREMARGMQKLAYDPVLRAEIGKRALIRSREFQPDQVMPKLIAFYKNLNNR